MMRIVEILLSIIDRTIDIYENHEDEIIGFLLGFVCLIFCLTYAIIKFNRGEDVSNLMVAGLIGQTLSSCILIYFG